jgi:hypothetical protein
VKGAVEGAGNVEIEDDKVSEQQCVKVIIVLSSDKTSRNKGAQYSRIGIA